MNAMKKYAWPGTLMMPAAGAGTSVPMLRVLMNRSSTFVENAASLLDSKIRSLLW